jgi:hypothetical protein
MVAWACTDWMKTMARTVNRMDRLNLLMAVILKPWEDNIFNTVKS